MLFYINSFKQVRPKFTDLITPKFFHSENNYTSLKYYTSLKQYYKKMLKSVKSCANSYHRTNEMKTCNTKEQPSKNESHVMFQERSAISSSECLFIENHSNVSHG